jgi:hypothetical protein
MLGSNPSADSAAGMARGFANESRVNPTGGLGAEPPSKSKAPILSTNAPILAVMR